jgi:hypothetical protein
MFKRSFAHLGSLLVVAALAGCATSRSEIRLTSPPPSPRADSGVELVIRSIEDARVFEERPPHPGTPSLGWGGAAAAPPEVKARAVGRKRNAYGRALGDVLLQQGETVVEVLRQNLVAALANAGYRVVDASRASPAALQMDVRIEKFWAWFQPGFWQITLNGDIATRLNFEGHNQPHLVSVAAQDKRQAAHDRAWVEILDMALAQYRAAVATEAANFPRVASGN